MLEAVSEQEPFEIKTSDHKNFLMTMKSSYLDVKISQWWPDTGRYIITKLTLFRSE